MLLAARLPAWLRLPRECDKAARALNTDWATGRVGHEGPTFQTIGGTAPGPARCLPKYQALLPFGLLGSMISMGKKTENLACMSQTCTLFVPLTSLSWRELPFPFCPALNPVELCEGVMQIAGDRGLSCGGETLLAVPWDECLRCTGEMPSVLASQ